LKALQIAKSAGKAALFTIGVSLVSTGADWIKNTLFEQGVVTIALGCGIILIAILWLTIQAEKIAARH